MIFTEKVKTDFKGLVKGAFVGDRAILEYFENIAGRHADTLGNGVNDISRTHSAWILLDWKVMVLHRPTYGEELMVTTWSHSIERCFGNRYFTIENEQGQICVAASSKWVLMDTEKWSIIRVDNELAAKFGSEPDRTIPIDPSLDRLKPPAEYSSVVPYTVQRRDIDLFGHVHNTNYLDLAYEALPEEVNLQRPFDSVRITYKKEIRLGEKLLLKYAFADGKHTVAITSEDGGVLHSLIELSD